MSDKLIQSFSKNCLFQTVIGVVVAGALCVAFACLAVGLTYFPNGSTLIPSLLVIPITIGGLLFVGGPVIILVLLNNRRIYTQLDQAFSPLGLTGSRYLLSGRQYQGSYRGRQVNVYYYISGRRYFRTPDLQLYVSGNIRTRLGIGTKTMLSQLGGAVLQQQPIALNDPAYEGLLAYALDESWSRNLLNDSQVRDAVGRLVGKDTPGVRGLVFSPDSVRVQLRHFQLAIITPDATRQWLTDLIALAETAEQSSPPSQVATASDWEQASRSDRSRFILPAIAIMSVLILCPFVITCGVFGALYLLGEFP